jgi:hypothetical protein
MARRSQRGRGGNDAEPREQQQGRSVAADVRERQRAVAEREASRLARPEQRRKQKLAHADRTKSAVSSTPFGVHKSSLPDSEQQGWCGPFSVARRMIEEREERRRTKEKEELEEQEAHHPLDAAMDEVNLEMKRKAHPSMTWKGDLPTSTPSSIYAKRQKRADVQRGTRTIPTLSQLCVDFVVSNFEHVESLGDVDNDVRVALSKELVRRNQLDDKAFEALVEPFMETLEIVDCAGIPHETMANALSEMAGLRYLLLTHAGRCFGPKSVNALLTTKAPLCCLSISGAYILKDEDVSKLIEANASTLQSISFDTSPLLGEKFTNAIQKTENLLEFSLQNITLPSGALKFPKETFKNLQSLTLNWIPGLTDAVLTELLEASGSLETLDVGHNYELTDACLSGIRQYGTKLRSLSLDGVKELTVAGLEALFTHPLEGLPPPPKLKVLKLSACDHQAVTNDVIALATASSSVFSESSDKKVSPYELKARIGGLAILNLNGSSLITDAMLEKLVETSANTLTDLNVSYCPLVSDQGLGYLVSKAGNQLSKVHVWGCAQLTDEFFDGHPRVNDRSFEIVGAWMKKSGMRSLR